MARWLQHTLFQVAAAHRVRNKNSTTAQPIARISHRFVLSTLDSRLCLSMLLQKSVSFFMHKTALHTCNTGTLRYFVYFTRCYVNLQNFAGHSKHLFSEGHLLVPAVYLNQPLSGIFGLNMNNLGNFTPFLANGRSFPAIVDHYRPFFATLNLGIHISRLCHPV